MSSKLFTPFTLRSVVFPNRCGVPSMCMYSCTEKPGYPTQIHMDQYATYADKGFGVICQEATAISKVGRITPDDLGLWEDEMIPECKKLVDNVHYYGSKFGVQLAHAGRKASTYSPLRPEAQHRTYISTDKGGWQVVGPSAIPFNDKHGMPKELTLTDIEEIKKDFVSAAHRAVKAGYDFVEVHGAHGYLLHEFLSPLTNVRKDMYGGSYENRTRLVKEVVTDVRKAIPKTMPIFVRLSATDYVEGGWNVEETTKLSKELVEKYGADLIHISTGGLSDQAKYPSKWDHQIIIADEIKKETKIPIACVGGIWNKETATNAIDDRNLDLVMVARATLRGAFYPKRIAHELKVEPSPQYPNHYRWATGVPAGNDY